MEEADLAAYQEALVSALSGGRDADDVQRRLSRARAARPHAAYVASFVPPAVDLHAWLARGWVRRQDEANKLEALARAASSQSFLWRLRSATAASVILTRSPWVRDCLRATASLPPIDPFRVGDEWVDSFRYYDASTLAYARPLDLLADAGVESVRGKKALELAYRSVLPLRLLGSVGARVVGVTQDPWKREVHAGIFERPTRALKLVAGSFPSKETLRAIGASYDLVLGWNAFTREPLPAGAEVPAALAAAVNLGGYVLLYDAHRASGAARVAPRFPRRAWERAGFRAVAFDRDDSRGLRATARALDWTDVADVRARYTLLQRT